MTNLFSFMSLVVWEFYQLLNWSRLLPGLTVAALCTLVARDGFLTGQRVKWRTATMWLTHSTSHAKMLNFHLVQAESFLPAKTKKTQHHNTRHSTLSPWSAHAQAGAR